MSQNLDELFDVVDENDNPIRREKRGIVHRDKLLHRAVHVLVFNGAGGVYCQRRSLTKDTCPGRWTTSCSGHVDAGEDYDTAAMRELGEELGIPVDAPPTLLFKYPACRETGWEFIHVYKLIWKGAIRPDTDEVMDGTWTDPTSLTEWMDRTPHDFAPAFRLVWREACLRGSI